MNAAKVAERRAPKELLDELRGELRRLEGGYGDPSWRRHVSTGFAALDEALPGGGLPVGAIIELEGLAWPPWTFAILLTCAILRAADDAEAVIVDSERDLYPPALAGLGLDLARTAIVWPRDGREAAWAFSEALAPRAAAKEKGSAVAIAALGPMSAPDRRRLQLAAEAGGGIGLLLDVLHGAGARRNYRVAQGAVRLRIETRRGEDELERFSVEVVRCRGGQAGGRVLVEVDRAALSLAIAPLF